MSDPILVFSRVGDYPYMIAVEGKDHWFVVSWCRNKKEGQDALAHEIERSKPHDEQGSLL